MPDPQDKFIDELDAAELPLAGTENLIISQEDFTRKISIDDLASQLPGGGAVDSVNGQTGVVVLDKDDVGLGNIDNTSDVNKPVSSATQTALNAKANTSSLATVATTGAYSDLSGTPSLATVATSGDYDDLVNQPSIPPAPTVNWVAVPASASATGAVGDLAVDTEFLYVCIAVDTWVRTPVVSWT